MLGGIKIPKHPPAHIIPDANFLSYPALTIAGQAKSPINVTTAPMIPVAVENNGKKETKTSFIITDVGGISSAAGLGAIDGFNQALKTA